MKKKDIYVHGDDVWGEYPGVSIAIERIYPETAKQMLKHNVGNRSAKKYHIADKALENDEWSLNGATIVFASDGRLLDGQHRLQACLRSGKPIDTVVVRGIDTESQISMDSGVRRSVADFLKMRGISDSVMIGGIGSSILRADTYGIEITVGDGSGTASRKFSTKETVGFIEDNLDLRIKPITRQVKALNKKYKGFRATTAAVLIDAFRNVSNDEDVDEFVDQLLGRKTATCSVPALQRRLYDNAMSTGKKLTQRYIAAITIKCWNDFINGECRDVLSYRAGGAHPEDFPVPVGPAAY